MSDVSRSAVHLPPYSPPSLPPKGLWYARCPVPTVSGIAQHLRWLHDAYAKDGIVLDSIRDAADRSVRDAHFDHTHPAMFREGGNIPPLWARAAGRDTAVVGITWIDEEQLVLTRRGSGIERPADLRGRRLGLPRHATHNVDFSRAMSLRGLVAALSLGGWAPGDAQFVDIDSPDIDLRDASTGHPRNASLDALLQERVDAIYVKGARGAGLAQTHDLHVVVDINAEPEPTTRINNGTPRPITVNRWLAVEHPEIVARYLEVLLDTAHWAESHPQEVVAAVAAETGTRAADVEKGYGPLLHTRLRPTLDDVRVDALRNQKDFLLAWDVIPADFDFDAWIVREPLAIAVRRYAERHAAALADA